VIYQDAILSWRLSHAEEKAALEQLFYQEICSIHRMKGKAQKG